MWLVLFDWIILFWFALLIIICEYLRKHCKCLKPLLAALRYCSPCLFSVSSEAAVFCVHKEKERVQWNQSRTGQLFCLTDVWELYSAVCYPEWGLMGNKSYQMICVMPSHDGSLFIYQAGVQAADMFSLEKCILSMSGHYLTWLGHIFILLTVFCPQRALVQRCIGMRCISQKEEKVLCIQSSLAF